MSYEEALTKVVKDNGWDSLQQFKFNEMRTSVIHSLTKEAAELYAKAKFEEAIAEMRAISELDSDAELPKFEP